VSRRVLAQINTVFGSAAHANLAHLAGNLLRSGIAKLFLARDFLCRSEA
jgi:hypothetical protein